jgi:type 1 glutamine amidotransferase
MKSKSQFYSLKWIYIILIIAASEIFATSICMAQTKQRVLIITGGHNFEREAFFDIFEDMTNVEYKEVIHPQANQLYDSSIIDDFDVLLFYDMVQEIDDSQKIAFIDLLKKGKAVVFLHHSLVSYQEWIEFEKIIGGRYILSDKEQEASTYRHDVEIPVEVVNKNHPITLGMDDFIIRDEVYGNYKVSSTVTPLLTTTHPESGEIIGWTNNYGKSRIVYIQLGHDHYAYANPNFRRLISQSIDWLKDK